MSGGYGERAGRAREKIIAEGYRGSVRGVHYTPQKIREEVVCMGHTTHERGSGA